MLAASSLHQIRDLDLLTAEFLEVMPNDRDQIEERYDAIRSAIIGEMNDKPLTPTHSRSHAPARQLIQGKASLKRLLSDGDIEFLMDYDDEPWRWATGVAQKNSNADRFLECLAVGTWDVDNFVELLCNKTASRRTSSRPEDLSPQEIMDWLRGKPVGWHQELYALLLTDHLIPAGFRREQFGTRLKSLQIVRLTDGSYGIGSESFFVSDGFEHDEVLRRVDARVYTTGKSKAPKENARAFLEEIGVREVGEAELVEAILKQRYTQEAEIPNEKTYRKDLKRFIELVETEPDKASLFPDYFIFQCGDHWRMPDGIFLDQPLPVVAWRSLAALNAGQLPAVGLEELRSEVSMAGGFPLDEAYPVLAWALSNVSTKYADTPHASRLLRPVFESTLLACQLCSRVVSRSASQAIQGREDATEALRADLGLLVRPGERPRAVAFLKDWIATSVQDYLKICDPYFGVEDLEVLQWILASNPGIRVQILTSAKHQEGLAQAPEEAYRSYWRMRLSAADPPDTDVFLLAWND